jgi:glycosyltransferase involved in cell wall biosynthesis
MVGYINSGILMKISVIVPVYNESKIINETIGKLRMFLDRSGFEYEVIICDDCSEDETYKFVKTVVTPTGKVVGLRFLRRIGKGGTIRNAVKVANGDVLLLMDADLPVNLDRISQTVRLAKSLNGLVIGIRKIVVRGSYGVFRQFLSTGYNGLVRILFKTGIRDHQAGYKAISSDVARKILDEVRTDGFLFDTEMIVNARRLRIPVRAMDVEWLDRRPIGGSKVIPFRAIATMLMDLIALRLSFIRTKKLLNLKTVRGGMFIDEKSGATYEITHLHFDVKRRGLMNFLRKIYFTIAFGGR